MSLTCGFTLQDTDSSQDFSDALHAVIGDGVAASGAQLSVSINGFTATVASGYVFVAGRWVENDEPLRLPLKASGNNEDRTDALVVRVDYDARKAALEVLADVDVDAIRADPSILRSSGTYSIVLYLIRVRRGATTIIPEDVTDMRDEAALCGKVTPLSAVAADVLYVYRFITSGIDEEIAHIMALSEAVADKADATIPVLDTAIQKAGGGPAVGDMQIVRRQPEPSEEWLLCDGRAVPIVYPVLHALLDGTLPELSGAGDRYRTYIYGGAPTARGGGEENE